MESQEINLKKIFGQKTGLSVLQIKVSKFVSKKQNLWLRSSTVPIVTFLLVLHVSELFGMSVIYTT